MEIFKNSIDELDVSVDFNDPNAMLNLEVNHLLLIGQTKLWN
jgi:hypothetical protein